MNTKETAWASAVGEHGRFYAERSRLQTQANALQLCSTRTVTVLIFAICAWSLIEAPFERGVSNDYSWPLALVVAKVIIVVSGVAAVIDVRFGRPIFAFFCCTSVLAIAPGLPLEFKHSVVISLLSLIECAGKASFVTAFCIGSMRDKPS
ncbi:hypothetical protein LMG28614_07013 [Paraburkholderia ultramafica]|uniref:Uncharacterized protein n=1 Tax=Paraburkholderia ultramafica TaxID=1544867 RepID=A0A6S7BQ32_9BURK|nr:hypothetical protein [Paraburkholderia ultramafica]CAB3809345.1 hypothetical protein LMG28614_07013 [Paraburkholderia ultramafica]